MLITLVNVTYYYVTFWDSPKVTESFIGQATLIKPKAASYSNYAKGKVLRPLRSAPSFFDRFPKNHCYMPLNSQRTLRLFKT